MMKKALLSFAILLLGFNLLNAQYIYPVSEYHASDRSAQLSNFDIKDTVLFLPLGESGLHILNIADINDIKEIKVYTEYEKRSRKKVYGIANEVNVNGNRLYLSFGPLGLKVMDITDPGMPYVIGTYYRYQDVYCTELYENFALLGYVGMGLEIVDLTNLNDIKMVSRNNVKDFSVQNIEVIPPYIVISGGSRGLKIFKFSDPFTTFKQADFPKDYLVESSANKLLIRNSTAYLANDFKGLTVLNMGLPAYPLKVNEIKTTGRAQDVINDRNYLYIASDKSIEVFDIKDPEKPQKIHEYLDKNKDFKSLQIYSDHLFASYADGKEYGIMIFQIE